MWKLFEAFKVSRRSPLWFSCLLSVTDGPHPPAPAQSPPSPPHPPASQSPPHYCWNCSQFLIIPKLLACATYNERIEIVLHWFSAWPEEADCRITCIGNGLKANGNVRQIVLLSKAVKILPVIVNRAVRHCLRLCLQLAAKQQWLVVAFTVVPLLQYRHSFYQTLVLLLERCPLMGGITCIRGTCCQEFVAFLEGCPDHRLCMLGRVSYRKGSPV